jgi:hypothetical protein
MKDSRHSGGASVPYHGPGISFRVTRMNNERELYFRGERYLGGEHVALHAARRVVVVIVETALTNRDPSGAKELPKPGEIARGVERCRIVRVNPSGGEHEARVFRRARCRCGASCQRFTDADYRDRARDAGAGDYLVAVAGERRVREVGVAVDEDRRASVLRGHLRSIQRRTGDAT